MGLLLLLIGLPVIEIFVLARVMISIGFWLTLLLIFLTAVFGFVLLRREGLATLQKVQAKLESGEAPTTEILEGMMLLVGGALLLTPGFVTDTVGLICLVPALRHPLARWLLNLEMFRDLNTRVSAWTMRHHYTGGATIEGELVPNQEESPEKKNL